MTHFKGFHAFILLHSAITFQREFSLGYLQRLNEKLSVHSKNQYLEKISDAERDVAKWGTIEKAFFTPQNFGYILASCELALEGK